MYRFAAAAVLAALACVPPGPAAPAADKPATPAAAKKPTGVWVRKANDATVTITIEDDALKTEVVTGDGGMVTVHGAYGVTADGVLFGVLTKVESKGGQGPEKGDLFSFQYKADKDVLTLSDFKGTHESPQAKQILEGDYKKK